ncbi:MAG: hypothetical protein WBB28_15870 [Crinalium sp.]
MIIKINCWLCNGSRGIIAPSETPSLPSLIRCSSCNANQGAVKDLNQIKK